MRPLEKHYAAAEDHRPGNDNCILTIAFVFARYHPAAPAPEPANGQEPRQYHGQITEYHKAVKNKSQPQQQRKTAAGKQF